MHLLPLLAVQVFYLDLSTSELTYILAFGMAKGGNDYLAGTVASIDGPPPGSS